MVIETPDCGAGLADEKRSDGVVTKVVCPFRAIPGMCPNADLIARIPPSAPYDPKDLRHKQRRQKVEGAVNGMRGDCAGPRRP